jgi:HK97 family phage portal protein
MAIVQSAGALEAVHRPWSPAYVPTSVSFYGERSVDYAALYRCQPSVRLVVSFLARGIAHLGLKVYRRVSDTDREGLGDHPLARVLVRPNPATTRYRLVEDLVTDLAVFGNAYWAKVKPADGPVALFRLPASRTVPTGDNPFYATGYRFTGNRGQTDLAADRVVHFRLPNPEDPRVGLSPLESLRRTLAEADAADEYRAGLWRSGARISGVITRPTDAPEWSDAARARFRASWNARYSGTGSEIGGTPILEDGMAFTEASFSARDSQYVESRRLSEEEVARAYHVPPPMVGLLEHATFSNITEQHAMLYSDCLGPWLTAIEDEIELQLLPDLDPDPRVYCEFNLAEKLKGRFEEQAAALSSSTGRPYMTANEARARMNLPRIDDPDADRLVVPLNVLIGGQASPRDSAPPPKQLGADLPQAVGVKARTGRQVDKHLEVLTGFFRRQRDSVFGKLGGKARKGPTVEELFDDARWNKELGADLLALAQQSATAAATAIAARFGTDVDPERMLAWLTENSRIAAEAINSATRTQLGEALADDDPPAAVRQVFELALGSRAARIAADRVTTTTSFGAEEGASQAGAGSKTWVVTSSNPRPSHAQMAGETVPVGELFSNGGKWPGDPALPADEVAGCSCHVEFER